MAQNFTISGNKLKGYQAVADGTGRVHFVGTTQEEEVIDQTSTVVASSGSSVPTVAPSIAMPIPSHPRRIPSHRKDSTHPHNTSALGRGIVMSEEYNNYLRSVSGTPSIRASAY